MADKTIGELPAIAALNDDALLAVEQQGWAGKMTGRQFREFGERSAREQADRAEAFGTHPPVVRDGTWWVWSLERGDYIDSGKSAIAVQYATFDIDPFTGSLSMNTPEEYGGPQFRLHQSNLEVTV